MRVLSTKEFTRRSLTLNNGFIYDKVIYVNSRTKIEIICQTHGSFWQLPLTHLNQRQGCPKCYGIVDIKGFTDKAIAVHGNKYDYSLVKYKNTQTKVEIICQIHGIFLQKPSKHTSNHGCPKCSGCYLKSTSDFIISANNVHCEIYDYSKSIYINKRSRLEIICKFHGSFWQSPDVHVNSRCGCPHCFKRFSFLEKEWVNSLGPAVVHSFKIPNTKYIADAYDPVTNTIYEFYGDYWHGNPNHFESNKINQASQTTFGCLYIKTMDRENVIKKLGYDIISIWESDYTNNKRKLMVIK